MYVFEERGCWFDNIKVPSNLARNVAEILDEELGKGTSRHVAKTTGLQVGGREGAEKDQAWLKGKEH